MSALRWANWVSGEYLVANRALFSGLISSSLMKSSFSCQEKSSFDWRKSHSFTPPSSSPVARKCSLVAAQRSGWLGMQISLDL